MAGKRHYSCNYNYFDLIDSKEKAYWLGFILADGCVIDNIRERKLKTCTTIQHRTYLQISLSSVDKEHIQKFLNCISSNHPIKEYKNNSGYKKGAKYCRVIIEDKHLCSNLIKYGVVPKKSSKEEFPIMVDKKYWIDIARGMFDADGCISQSIDKRKNIPSYEINYTGTYNMCMMFAEIIGIDMSNKKLFKRHNNSINNYTFRCSGNQKVYKALSKLYEDVNICLERKYNKYLELQKYINGRYKQKCL